MRVAALALLLVGCTDDVAPSCGDGHVDPGETCDDGNNEPGDGCTACTIDVVPRTLHVAWTLRVAQSPQPLQCPAGYDSAVLVTQALAADGSPTGDERVEVAPCSAGSASVTFDAGAVGDVRASVRIVSGIDGSVYAESLPQTVSLGSADANLAVAILTNGGYIHLGWSLVGETSGTELTCATVEPDAIDVESAGPSTFTDHFTCTDGEGLTGALPAGTYSLTITPMMNGNSLGPPATVNGVVVLDRNRVNEAGTVELPISGL